MKPLLILHLLWISGLVSCNLLPNDPPVARLTVEPSTGDTSTVFYLDASATEDDLNNSWELKVRWDMNSDGIWEKDFSNTMEYVWTFRKEGTYKIILECMDSDGNLGRDTTEVNVMQPIRDSVILDHRDGREYKVTYLFSRWWMAESLKYGVPLGTRDLPSDNGMTEYYLNPDHTEAPYGGYYSWEEATDYGRDTSRGICPEGWHLPRVEDWHSLTVVSVAGHNGRQYFGINGLYRLNFEPTGFFHVNRHIYQKVYPFSYYWATQTAPIRHFRYWLFFNDTEMQWMYEGSYYTPAHLGWNNDWGYFSSKPVAVPVRCVKDEK